MHTLLSCFISSPYLLFLGAHQCFSFPFRWCNDGFQCVDGSCFLLKIPFTFLVLEKSHRQNYHGYWLINISLKTSKAPAFTYLSPPVLCQFQQWGMPWSWNRHKIQMNQCPSQSNYHQTQCPCWPSRTNRRSKSFTVIHVRFICDSSGSFAQARPIGALHHSSAFLQDWRPAQRWWRRQGPGLVHLHSNWNKDYTAHQGWRSSVVITLQGHF